MEWSKTMTTQTTDDETANKYVPLDDIHSSFQELANIDADRTFPKYATAAYEGTHSYGDWSCTRTYTVERYGERRDDRLAVYVTYHDDGEQVQVDDYHFELTDDGDHVAHSGESIEEFCRSNHSNDPQMDIEIARTA